MTDTRYYHDETVRLECLKVAAELHKTYSTDWDDVDHYVCKLADRLVAYVRSGEVRVLDTPGEKE